MLTAQKLEKIIELEDNLRAQYQTQLDEKTAEIELHLKKHEEQQEIIAKQLAQLTTQSAERTNASNSATANCTTAVKT